MLLFLPVEQQAACIAQAFIEVRRGFLLRLFVASPGVYGCGVFDGGWDGEVGGVCGGNAGVGVLDVFEDRDAVYTDREGGEWCGEAAGGGDHLSEPIIAS